MNEQSITRAITVISSGDWLGWMFAIAIILGGVLDNKGRDLIGWCASVAIYAIFNLAVANTYMSRVAVLAGRSPVVVSTDSIIFVMLTLTIYCVGLCLGWFIVWFTKHRSHVHHIAKRLREADDSASDDPIQNGGDPNLC